MKKVLIAFAVIIAMAAYGKKQAAAPETESSEVSNEVVTNDTISPEMKEANMQEVQATNREYVHSAFPRLSMAVCTS